MVMRKYLAREEVGGLTPHGKDFALRVLHPNDDTTEGGVFVPDSVSVGRAVFENRHSMVLSSPSGLVGDNWDIEILTLPVPDVPLVYRTKASDSPTWSYWKAAGNNSGTIPAGLFQPGNTAHPLAAPVLTPKLISDTDQFRQAFKGLTIVMNSSSLHNEGYVTAGQWGDQGKLTELYPHYGSGTASQRIAHMYFEDIPDSPDEIVIKCGQAGQWEAKKGIYMPSRYDKSTNEMSSGFENDWEDPDRNITRIGAPILLQGSNATVDTINYRSDVVFFNDVNSQIVCTAGRTNQSLGCAIFTGLNKSAQLICKVRSGVEVCPTSQSSWAAFGESNVPMDENAIKLVSQVQARLPVVFEHKYNSAGLLLPLVARIAATVLPSIMPWIGSKIRNVFGSRAKARYVAEGPD
jgi:hypothetical protein